MPITRNNNKETDLIIGNHFPTDNEETFAADATNQRNIASNLRELAEQISTARKLISENMSGQTAQQYVHALEDQEKSFATAAENHDTLAEGLEATANNIAVTKANMNSVDDNFHQNMENLQQWGVSSGQVQEQMNAERTKLLDEAQENIRKGETELSSFQQEAVNNLNNGRSVGSYATFKLNDGAVSTPLIDAKGTGFVGTGVSSGLSSNRETTNGIVSAPTSGQAKAPRYTSSDSATGLSSVTTLDKATGTSSAVSSGGFAVPTSISSQNQASTTGSNAPVMGAGVGALGAGLGTATGAGTQSAAGNGARPSTGSSVPTGSTSRNKTTNTSSSNETVLSEQWSKTKNELVQVAVTLWQNLAAMGWENPVAVAKIRDESGAEKIVWATNFGAAFIPDRVTTDKATPIDVSLVSDKVRKQLISLPSSFALDLWIQHTGVEVAERVVLARESEKVAPGFDKIDYVNLFTVNESELLNNVDISSDKFTPETFENPISKAKELAQKASFSIGEALQFASFAQRNNSAISSGDNTDLSAAGYMRQAVYDTMRLKLEAGDEEGYDFLIWQALQFDEIA